MYSGPLQCSSDGKVSAYNAGHPGSIPDRKDPLEKEMATHSSILAWKIPWTEATGRLQSMGSQRVGHDWAASLSFFFHFQCRTNDQKQPANRTLKHWDSMLFTALKLIYSRNREKYINICILACCAVAESCPTLCDPVDWSTPGFWVLHCLPEFARQTHVHWVGELSNHLILCRPLLLLPSPFLESESFPMSQHQVAKVLELQLQHHLLFWLNCD